MAHERNEHKTLHGFSPACRRPIAGLLLLLLLIQISPFTLQETPSVINRGPGQGVTPYVKPLQVCNDNNGLGGIIADHFWMPSLTAEANSFVHEIAYLPEPTLLLPQGHSSRLFRPPRA